jgi:hypothetical protein
MRDRRLPALVLVLIGLSGAGCATGNVEPSRFVSATSVPTRAPTPVISASATPTIVIAATPPTDAPTASPTVTVRAWTGSMESTSNYTVTSQDGGLVCSGQWTTYLAFDVDADSKISGRATTDAVSDPECTHPELLSTPVTSITSSIEGTLTTDQLQLRFMPVSFVPEGAVDSTGMSSSIYGIGTAPPTLTIPVVAPGHAIGTQQLQTVSGSNAYTSVNTTTLDCQGC